MPAEIKRRKTRKVTGKVIKSRPKAELRVSGFIRDGTVHFTYSENRANFKLKLKSFIQFI